jgi:hypothetical protein
MVPTMKKLNLLIAALHAGALALGAAAPGVARAQDAQEIRAYMDALSTGTAEAMSAFLAEYPNSALPGSELGASIAAGLDQPTAATTPAGAGASATAPSEDGIY